MRSYLILLLLLSPSLLLANPPSQNTSSKNTRILNGQNASQFFQGELLTENLFVVFLQMYCRSQLPLSRGCTGSLIDERTILTAAHCFDDCPDNDLVAGAALGLELEKIVEVRKLSRRIVHPDYNYPEDDEIPEHDVALWFLEEPFTVVKHFAKLPTNDLYTGSRAIAAGYGRTATEATSNQLQFIRVTILPGEMCEYEDLPDFDFRPIYPDVEICAGDTGPPDPENGLWKIICYGDSGGPLYSDDGYVYGVSVWGSIECIGRGAVFCKVSAYREWIISQVRQVNGYRYQGDGRASSDVLETESALGDEILQEDIHPRG